LRRPGRRTSATLLGAGGHQTIRPSPPTRPLRLEARARAEPIPARASAGFSAPAAPAAGGRSREGTYLPPPRRHRFVHVPLLDRRPSAWAGRTGSAAAASGKCIAGRTRRHTEGPLQAWPCGQSPLPPPRWTQPGPDRNSPARPDSKGLSSPTLPYPKPQPCQPGQDPSYTRTVFG
jgi:hypothetical protein